MEGKKDIGERLLEFSAEVVKVLNDLPSTPVARKLEDQLIRSATSVGANYEEAKGTSSRADFCYKLQIALKEMRETRYWLCLLWKSGLLTSDTVPRLVDEATQLRAILGKSIATARGTTKVGPAGGQSKC